MKIVRSPEYRLVLFHRAEPGRNVTITINSQQVVFAGEHSVWVLKPDSMLYAAVLLKEYLREGYDIRGIPGITESLSLMRLATWLLHFSYDPEKQSPSFPTRG